MRISPSRRRDFYFKLVISQRIVYSQGSGVIESRFEHPPPGFKLGLHNIPKKHITTAETLK